MLTYGYELDNCATLYHKKKFFTLKSPFAVTLHDWYNRVRLEIRWQYNASLRYVTTGEWLTSYCGQVRSRGGRHDDHPHSSRPAAHPPLTGYSYHTCNQDKSLSSHFDLPQLTSPLAQLDWPPRSVCVWDKRRMREEVVPGTAVMFCCARLYCRGAGVGRRRRHSNAPPHPNKMQPSCPHYWRSMMFTIFSRNYSIYSLTCNRTNTFVKALLIII